MNFSKTELNGNAHRGESEIVEFRSSVEINLQQIERELFGDTNSTPLGQLLEMIGSLPEIRHEKVYNVRDRLDTERYDMDNTLDSAIDKVLEELLSDS
ncbi:MAG: hypothetical protein FVQ82_07500 [Planctomycetes bacterium]|nr:hypothetical protein [Planctomycetota bacterium]